MKLLRGLKKNQGLGQGCVATIGNFDGVHLGHQALLKQLRVYALMRHLPLLVFVFEPQPSEYFNPSSAPSRLSSLREKIVFLKHCGVDYVYCLKFNKALASMAADEFAHFIFTHCNVRHLLVGDDFRFGKNRSGNGELLQSIGSMHGCEVDLFAPFLQHQTRVSSTLIRQALRQGDLKRAQELLGRVYHVCGRVVHGNGVGRTFGIPTANLNLQRHTLPMSGVFVVKVKCKGNFINGVANLGCRPTIDGTQQVLEIHLLDFNEMIYGEWLHVYFLQHVREEKKFSSIEQLVLQIKADIEYARAFFIDNATLQSESYD